MADKKILENLFFHLVDLATVNASILHKSIAPQSKTWHYQFRENLVRALCCAPEVIVPRCGSRGRPAKDATVKHHLIQTTKRVDCVYCKIVHQKRQLCSRTCAACKVPLCFTWNRDFFVKFHDRHFQYQWGAILQNDIDCEEQSITSPSTPEPTITNPVGRPPGSFKVAEGERLNGSQEILFIFSQFWSSLLFQL